MAWSSTRSPSDSWSDKQREDRTGTAADDVEVAIGRNCRPIERRRHARRTIDECLLVEQRAEPA
jgi:hypothetical protein